MCPYHRQKKIEKEEEEKKRIINGSDKYKFPVTIIYPDLVYWYIFQGVDLVMIIKCLQ